MNQLVNISSLGSALAQVQTSEAKMKPLVRFLAREGGAYVFGKDAEAIPAGAQFAINPTTIERGYVCWKDKKPVGQVMAPPGAAIPQPHELEDHGVDSKGKQTKWDTQWSFEMRGTSANVEGLELMWSSSTVGGVNATKTLAQAIGLQINSGTQYFVPVIEMSKSFYEHPEYGKTYTPEFTIVSWVDMDGNAEKKQGRVAQA